MDKESPDKENKSILEKIKSFYKKKKKDEEHIRDLDSEKKDLDVDGEFNLENLAEKIEKDEPKNLEDVDISNKDSAKKGGKNKLTGFNKEVGDGREEDLDVDGEFNLENLAEKIEDRSSDFGSISKVDVGSVTEDLGEFVRSSKEGVAHLESLEGFEERDRYWVNEPYSFVAILYNEENEQYLYRVVEPKLNESEVEIRNELETRLIDTLMREKIEDSDSAKEKVLEDNFYTLLDIYNINIDPDSRYKILYYLKRDYVGYEKIDPIIRDPYIEDISCNAPNSPIFVYHQDYSNLRSNITVPERELNNFIIKLAQKGEKHISVSEPLVDASLPQGYRVQLSLGREVTSRGSSFTIRKYGEEPFSPIRLVDTHTFSTEQMAYLWLCIENNMSLIFAGGTGSGKTTSMNAISVFIPPGSKVSSIEDTRELAIRNENWIPSVTREPIGGDERGKIDMFQLLTSALRQRPEYILVGEVRGKEATTLFQAMSTGHTCYSTLHADSVESAIHRLTNPPIDVPRAMIEALDIVSVQVQVPMGNKRVRRSHTISEILGVDPRSGNIRTDTVFRWESTDDTFQKVGNSTVLEELRRSNGWSSEKLQKELDHRQELLEYLLEEDITSWDHSTKVIQSFMRNKSKVLDKIRTGTLDKRAIYRLEN